MGRTATSLIWVSYWTWSAVQVGFHGDVILVGIDPMMVTVEVGYTATLPPWVSDVAWSPCKSWRRRASIHKSFSRSLVASRTAI